MTTDQGQVIPVKLVDNHDGTYRVEFEATSVGVYNTSVTFAGQLTPASPYKITVQQSTAVDTSKVRVTDLPDSMSVLSSTHCPLSTVQRSLSAVLCVDVARVCYSSHKNEHQAMFSSDPATI